MQSIWYPGRPGESTIDHDFEIFYARRALRRLKRLIGRDGLLQLLAEDIEVGNSFMRQHAVQSNGELRAATTVMAVEGLKASEFVGLHGRNLDRRGEPCWQRNQNTS